MTLVDLSKRYLRTVQRHKPKTVERKTAIIARIAPSAVPQNGTPHTSHWPTGELTQVGKVKPSDCDVWLSRYSFGSASRNLYIGIFEGTFRARRSRPCHCHFARRASEIGQAGETDRLTPSFEQFKAIIADVRAQQFNADAQDSADFLEFLGLAGLGQAEGG